MQCRRAALLVEADNAAPIEKKATIRQYNLCVGSTIAGYVSESVSNSRVLI